MPLKIIRRKDTGALTIAGTLEFPDGSRVRVRRRAQSDDRRLAEEEANTIEKQVLRDAWHGERRGVRSFAEAVMSYGSAMPRAKGDRMRLARIMTALGDVPLRSVNQSSIDKVSIKLLGPQSSPATVRRGIIAPIRAVMRHAHRRGWCDAPIFEIPRQPEGRTLYLLPAEAERLVAAAAPHIRTLLLLLLGTGARMSEALELDWRDVDLLGARAIFWRTKGGKRRIASLPPRTVTALMATSCRQGPVIRWEAGKRRDGAPKRIAAYADRSREGGGQIKTAWGAALRRAGLNPDLTPHDCRHTWASWHYAIHHDMLALKAEGGWSSVALVERYAHLMPNGHEAGIMAFWRLSGPVQDTGEFPGEATA